MGKQKQGVSGWEASARGTLRDLGVKDMPSFEVLFLDELAGWAFSVRNPGHGYNEEHGVLVVATLLRALERARSFRPAQAPEETGGIVATREKVVAGAHAFARKRKGVAHLAGLLAAAAIPELEHSARQPAAQTYWLFHYALLVLASGPNGEERTRCGGFPRCSRPGTVSPPRDSPCRGAPGKAWRPRHPRRWSPPTSRRSSSASPGLTR